MYPISDKTKVLFESEQRQVLRITGTDGNGESIHITEADIVQGGFSIDRYSCNGDRLEIGTAVAAEMSLKLDNRDGRFDDTVFEGAEMLAEIGVADWSQDEPEIAYIPCGYFISDDQPRRLTTIALHGLDRMVKFDKLVNETALTFPATVKGLVGQMCAACGVTLGMDIDALPNAAYSVAALPNTQQTVTYRNLIQWCAGLMGTNAWIDWNGELRFSWYNNATGYTATTENRFNSDLYENPIVITGVEYMNEYDDVYLAGTDDYTLDLSDNSLLNDENADSVLVNIYNVVHDFAYTPFSATVIAAPYLWPMDRVVFTDKNGNGHVSALTNVNIALNGNTGIASRGETAQSNSAASPASFTSQQQQELKRIQRVNSEVMQGAVEHATEMITGGLGGYVVLNVNDETGQTEEILIMDSPDKETAINVWRFNAGGLGHSSNGYNGPFNDIALTADGQINANMITVGEMVADMIKGGTLTLGGEDNVNGTLDILDANGNTIGSWSQSGIVANRGTIGNFKISGGELTYGSTEKGGTGGVLGPFGLEYAYTYPGDVGTYFARLGQGSLRVGIYDRGSAAIRPGQTQYGGMLIVSHRSDGTTKYPIEVEEDASSGEVIFGSGYNVVVKDQLQLKSPLAVDYGGTGATTAAGAKANLGLGTAAMNVTVGNYNGVDQHWGIGAVVQASTQGTKAYLNKRTTLVTTDTGLFLYCNSDNKTVWTLTEPKVADFTPTASGVSVNSCKAVKSGNLVSMLFTVTTAQKITKNTKILDGLYWHPTGYYPIWAYSSSTGLTYLLLWSGTSIVFYDDTPVESGKSLAFEATYITY